MMLVFARIFLGSKLLQAAAAAVVALGIFKVWQIRERNIGARVEREKVEKKADANAKLAEEIRRDVDLGKPTSSGVRGKYQRSDN